MNKAYLIDAENRTVTETKIESWKDIAPKIGCELFTVVNIEKEDALYVDDEGLLKQPEHFFLYKGYNQPLAGNGLVMGTDEEGDSTDPQNTLEEIKSRITFMNTVEVVLWSRANNR